MLVSRFGGHTHFLTSHHHLLHYGMPCFLKHLIVLSSGTDAHPMLCHLCTSCGNKTQPAIKMVPPILSMLKIKKPYPAQIPQKPEGVSPFGKAAFRFCLWQVDNSAMPPTPEEGSP
ncbi:hypothetical protein CK203_011010 [Vitis vinifera]|uniref:Uncharacterized protein n=1 Tax=Vitis vinifera TaxID=29760 RepID=A0A438JIQ5_VITVI|nr:hypothetical protein CK203_011010 [Vitis vinifera]